MSASRIACQNCALHMHAVTYRIRKLKYIANQVQHFYFSRATWSSTQKSGEIIQMKLRRIVEMHASASSPSTFCRWNKKISFLFTWLKHSSTSECGLFHLFCFWISHATHTDAMNPSLTCVSPRETEQKSVGCIGYGFQTNLGTYYTFTIRSHLLASRIRANTRIHCQCIHHFELTLAQ